jgi:transcriptional repressor NrdR
MKCPYCSFLESKVTDSRTAPETNAIRRRRECLGCLKRFTTFESVDLTVQVRKRDSSYEDFVLEKLVRGLDAACRRTKVSHEQVLAIAYIRFACVYRRFKDMDELMNVINTAQFAVKEN